MIMVYFGYCENPRYYFLLIALIRARRCK